MKTYFTAALVAVVSCQQRLKDLTASPTPPAPAQTNILTGDFITGFESGIFLREREDELKEYGCPKAMINLEGFTKVKEMLPAVTTMVGVMNQNDPEMKSMLETLTLFVNHLDELIGVFDADYTGGDFCAGLTFGQAGSNMLYKIASMIIHENIKQMEKTKN